MDKIIFSILGIISLLPAVFSGVTKSYTCDGDLELQCTEGEINMLAINTAERFDLTACPDRAAKYTTPSPKLISAVWNACNGKAECSIQTGIRLEDYRYFDVVYDCGTGYDMCSDNNIVILANSSYLRSPNDFVFKAREGCECVADLEEPANLTVRVVDQRFNVTMPRLEITYLNKTETIGKRSLEARAKQFKIAFTSNHQAGSGSFLLRYEADRQITMVCNQEETQRTDLATILIAPIAMIALLIVIAILFFIIKGIKKYRRQRLQVAAAQQKGTDAETGHNSKPDLLNYGSTESDTKSDIPLTEDSQGGGMKS